MTRDQVNSSSCICVCEQHSKVYEKNENLLDNDHKITLTLWGVLASVGQVAVVVELAFQLVR